MLTASYVVWAVLILMFLFEVSSVTVGGRAVENPLTRLIIGPVFVVIFSLIAIAFGWLGRLLLLPIRHWLHL